ncbi:hypothetical protein [Prescottella subtropica]|nr:hypothetical protein [Prescottella subtropica]
MSQEIEQARKRYRAAIKAGDRDEFIAAKSDLIKKATGTTIPADQIDYI